MEYHLVLYIIGCVLIIGFLAGIEIAFLSVNKINVELFKKQGTNTGKILARFYDNPEEFIGASLIGINIVLVIYGMLMTQFTNPILEKLPSFFHNQFLHLVLDTTIATLVILIFAEFIPKVVFRAQAEPLLKIFTYPMLVIYTILSPLAKLFVNISEWILKYLFGVKIKENQIIFNRVDLEHFVKQSTNGAHETENNELNTELFENALYLTHVKIRKCMVPRNEIVSLEINTPIQEVKLKFIKTQLSKIIVYENTIDNIVGYLHHIDLNKHPTNIKSIIHKIPAIPEAMNAVDLMNMFTKERKSIAWVIDEFGGTSGIVTMEDVLEEIFGDINDEYDEQEYVEKQISEYEYIFSGRLELEYLNEKYNLTFPTGDSETLSGYIIENHETIPNNGDKIVIDKFEFDILLVTDTRIDTVKLKLLH